MLHMLHIKARETTRDLTRHDIEHCDTVTCVTPFSAVKRRPVLGESLAKL